MYEYLISLYFTSNCIWNWGRCETTARKLLGGFFAQRGRPLIKPTPSTRHAVLATRQLTRLSYLGIMLAIFGMAGGTASGTAQESPAHRGSIERLAIPASSLKGNLLGDPISQKALVYLPFGYDRKSTRRYPVLYLLHGFSLGPILEDWGEVTSGVMDSFVTSAPDKAFIVVIPNGANSVSGSFYMNSSVSGNWETYITSDLVHYIDDHYRTLTDRRSRAIAGHSMGGFAALRIAMTHSELFSTAYAMSPCCLDLQDDFTSSNPEWTKVLALQSVADVRTAASENKFWVTALAAFAIAASPDSQAGLKADLPYRMDGEKIVPQPEVIARWKAAMPLDMIADHESNLKSLTGVAVDYGFEDDFTHIPDTARQFGEELLALRIPILIEGYHGDHNNKVPERVGTRMIPYIASKLSFAP